MTALQTTGIDHLNIEVADLDKTVAFYKALLGFEVLEELPADNGKIIGNDSAKLCIYEAEGFSGYRNKVGLHHIGFNIKNFDDVKARCDELGVKILYDTVVQWPGSQSFYVKDPSGYELELTEVWGAGLKA
jgi:catechol 2,3-dioxygenase-like lactoylglutathione lyase family enzyme